MTDRPTLLDKIDGFLREHTEDKFIAKDIAQKIVDSYPDEYHLKAKKSKQQAVDVVQQVAAEIGSSRKRLQRAYPQIKTTETRPRKYYWTEKSDEAEAVEANATDVPRETSLESAESGREPELKESHLYQKLSEYLRDEHELYSRRIDEKKSSNRRGERGNIWLHPDVVAMEDLSRRWHPNVRDCVEACHGKKVRLWSFEVKLKLNRSNIRDCYMQAVSNCAWANLGYLVAAEVTESKNQEAMEEFRVLHSLHGIGLILLTPDNPAESIIRVYARERPEVDWTTCNRLAEENSDFRTFLVNVTREQKGFIDRNFWDAAPPEAEL